MTFKRSASAHCCDNTRFYLLKILSDLTLKKCIIVEIIFNFRMNNIICPSFNNLIIHVNIAVMKQLFDWIFVKIDKFSTQTVKTCLNKVVSVL